MSITFPLTLSSESPADLKLGISARALLRAALVPSEDKGKVL